MAGKESACHKEFLVASTFLFTLPDTGQSCWGVTMSPDSHSPGPTDAHGTGTGRIPQHWGPHEPLTPPKGLPSRNPTQKATEGLPNGGMSPPTDLLWHLHIIQRHLLLGGLS